MSRSHSKGRLPTLFITLSIAALLVAGCHIRGDDEPCEHAGCCSGSGWGSGGSSCGGCPYGPGCRDMGGWPGDDAGPPPTPTSDAGAPDALVPNCWTFTTRQGGVCVACEDDVGEVVSCTGAQPPTGKTCHELTIDGLSCLVCHDAAGVLESARCGGGDGDGGGGGQPDSGGCGGSDAGAKADLCSCP